MAFSFGHIFFVYFISFIIDEHNITTVTKRSLLDYDTCCTSGVVAFNSEKIANKKLDYSKIATRKTLHYYSRVFWRTFLCFFIRISFDDYFIIFSVVPFSLSSCFSTLFITYESIYNLDIFTRDSRRKCQLFIRDIPKSIYCINTVDSVGSIEFIYFTASFFV